MRRLGLNELPIVVNPILDKGIFRVVKVKEVQEFSWILQNESDDPLFDGMIQMYTLYLFYRRPLREKSETLFFCVMSKGNGKRTYSVLTLIHTANIFAVNPTAFCCVPFQKLNAVYKELMYYD